MYCAACNLSYPDHLSFCRRCGQPLARSASDPVMDTICCTRCGARTVKGENFCQECGNRIVANAQETVVGACYHCGTSWRSGWLFCKTCGLDRDRALLLPTSMPAAASTSAQTVLTEAEQLTEVVRLFCKRCGAAAKPYSRFCETCGNSIGLPKVAKAEEPAEGEARSAVNTGKLAVPPASAAFRTQTDSPSSRLQAPNQGASQIPATVEPLGVGGGRKTTAFNDSLTRNISDETDALASRPTLPDPETVITTLSEPAPGVGSFEAENSIRRSDSRGSTVVWMIIIALTVAAGGVAWRLLNNQKGLRPSVDPLASQATDQPTPQVAAASPEIAPSPEQAVVPSAPDGMVFVPGGSFKMGRNDGDEFESPAHTVTVEPFFIDRTEVTNEEYQRFVSATGHRAPAHWIGGRIPDGQAKFPVVNVSWDDAHAYAQWANKRLPTESEWELAARGTDGRLYPWGNSWRQDRANAGQAKGGALLEVGRYAAGASPFGALDMCGNAWEWTASDFKDYPGRKTASSLASAGLKVIRGGAYDVTPGRATTTYRGAISPDRVPDKTGFRCARDAQ